MNTRMKYYILAIAILFSLVGCEDFFEPKLSNELTLEQIENQKQTDILGWVTKSYRSFNVDPDGWNGNFLDCATDNAVTNMVTNGLNTMQTVDGNWRSTSNPVGNWKSRYDDIRHINMYLETGRDTSILYRKSDLYADELIRTQTTSMAFIMRAWEQFLLLRHNSGYDDAGNLLGFPIVTTVFDADNYEQLSRNTFDECVNQIVEDIDSALLVGGLRNKWSATPYNDINGEDRYGAPTTGMCYALKSRVLLYAASPAYTVHLDDGARKALYAKAAQASLEAIDQNAPGRTLPNIYDVSPSNQNAISAAYFNAPENDELIMRRLKGKDKGSSTDYATRNYPPIPVFNGTARCNPSQNLVDAFPMINGYPRTHTNNLGYDDQTMYANRDPRFYMTVLYNGATFSNLNGTRSATIETFDGGNCMLGQDYTNETNTTRTGYLLRKWLDTETNLITGQETGSYYYNVIFRKAELFLNYAEAAYNAYGWTGAELGFTAKEALREVRRRAGIPLFGADAYLNEVAGDEILALIKNERRIELCFEGHRFWDVRRWKESLVEPVTGVQITNDNGAVSIARKTLFTPVYKDYMYYLPLPNNELLKTENLVQNKGW